MKTLYELHIKLPELEDQVVTIYDRLVFGSSESCDICLSDFGLAPKHCIFNLQNGVLIVQNLGGSKATKVNRQKLEQGKTYILDHKDKVTLGEVVVLVQEIEVEDSVAESMSASQTDPSFIQEQTSPSQIFPEQLEEEETEEENEEEDDEEDEDSFTPIEPTSIEIGQLLRNSPEAKQGLSKPSSEHSTLHKFVSRVSNIFSLSQYTKKKKGPSLLGSQKAPELKASPKKFKSSGTSKEIPGIVIRTFALAFQVLLCWLIVNIMIITQGEMPEVQAIYAKVLTILQVELSPLEQLLSAKLEREFLIPYQLIEFDLFVFIVFYLAVDLSSHILLGVSLGHWFFGVREISDQLVSRIKGLFRCVLNWVLFPFLIFDLMILFKRRTFKEWITASVLEKRSPLMTLVTLFLFTPALVLALQLLPIFSANTVTNTFDNKKILLNEDEGMNLKYFRFTTMDLDIPWSDELDSLSLFEWQEDTVNSQFALTLWDNRTTPLLTLKKGRSFDLRRWIRNYSEHNRLMTYLDPELLEFAKESTPSVVTPDFEKKFVHLLKTGFAYNYSDPLFLQENLIKYGPLLSSFLSWRDFMIKELNLGEDDRMEYWELGEKSWLMVFRQIESGQEIEVFPLQKAPGTSLNIMTKTATRQAVMSFLNEDFIYYKPIKIGLDRKVKLDHEFKERWLILPMIDLVNHFLINREAELSEDVLEDFYQKLYHKASRLFQTQSIDQPYGLSFAEQLTVLEQKIRERSSGTQNNLQDFLQKLNYMNQAIKQRRSDFFTTPTQTP